MLKDPPKKGDTRYTMYTTHGASWVAWHDVWLEGFQVLTVNLGDQKCRNAGFVPNTRGHDWQSEVALQRVTPRIRVAPVDIEEYNVVYCMPRTKQKQTNTQTTHITLRSSVPRWLVVPFGSFIQHWSFLPSLSFIPRCSSIRQSLTSRSVVVSCSVLVYRHRLSPRERVGVHFDALPRY